MSYLERKAERKAWYDKYVAGWKQRPCTACGGSGRHDNYGSPKCYSCKGTGKEKYKPVVGNYL